jgi:hypothetical protein
MVIIGLGGAGRTIAQEFKKWSQYRVITPKIPIYETVEEYEEKTPNFKRSFKGVKDEVWFIVCGTSKEAACSLRILEQIKHCKVKILYVYPEVAFLSAPEKKRHRVVFSVLQEYARSGLLDSMYLVSNETIEQMSGGGTINNYYNKINETIASLVHYYNIYRNTDPVMGTIQQFRTIARIRTFGMFDMDKNEEKLLFSLDKVTDTCYIYNITRDDLENDNTLLGNIKEKTKINVINNINSSFVVYETDYDQNFCHMIACTHFVQEEK